MNIDVNAITNVYGSDQEALNQMTKERLDEKIKYSQPNAQEAISTLIEEGKIAKDYIAPLGVNLKESGEKPIITFGSNGTVRMKMQDKEFTIHPHAIEHLAGRFGVPSGYLKKLATSEEQWARDLCREILNEHSEWTDRSRVLVRSVGSEVRGVLSDHYRRLNSEELVMAFIKAGTDQGAVLSDGFMDDTKLFVDMMIPEPVNIKTEKNGIVSLAFGARISTSDYGDGALELRSSVMQVVCTNEMVRESIMRQIHLGGRLPDNLSLSENTYKLDTETQASAINDLTSGLLSTGTIKDKAQEVVRSAELEVDIEKELKGLSRGKMNKEEVVEVERVLIQNKPDDGVQGESTLWKLVQGITAHAREVEPRRKRELQEIAGDLMNRVK